MWARAETEIELFLIRHGKTKANEEHRYLGKTEEKLSESGKIWIRKEREQKKYPSCQFVFSSPMIRCKETAELIYPHQEIDVIEEWSEINFGKFEYKTYKELEKDPDYIRWIASNGTLPFPEGESREAFIERTKKGWKHLLEILVKQKKTAEKIQAAAIVHGGTIMTICSFLEGGEYFDYQVKNGEGYRCVLQYSKENIRLLKMERL